MDISQVFEIDGVTYRAEVGGGTCLGCAFYGKYECRAPKGAPPCHHVDRPDELDCIFVVDGD